MVSRMTMHGVAGALLLAGAAVLLLYRDMVSIDPWYMLLLLGGTAGASFAVGYIAGFLTEGGFGPPPDGRE
jgi:hypothetical protein